MRLLLIISKEHPVIALAEIKAQTSNIFTRKGVILVDSKTYPTNLSYTKEIHRILFNSTERGIVNDFEKYNWQGIYKKDYSLRGLKEKKLAKIIWKKLKNPKVNLKNATTKIYIKKIKNRIYVTKLLWKNEERFEKRKAHRLPSPHPTTAHPKLARAMINLTGIKKGKVYDPFCGSGGVLIEAGLMGLAVEGSDIDKKMIKRAKKNLANFKIKSKIYIQNATNITKTYNYVVTDLPYGRNSKLTKNIDELYKEFFEVLENKLKKKAVIGMPSNTKIKTKLKIEKKFKFYIHKSLSKKLLVLSPLCIKK